MNAADIPHFIYRLTHGELPQKELAALTTRDLDTINHYLAERLEPVLAARRETADLFTTHPARTYSEEEILLELGLPD